MLLTIGGRACTAEWREREMVRCGMKWLPCPTSPSLDSRHG